MFKDLEKMPNGVGLVLWQMFKDGPTWDGNIADKQSRNWLEKNAMSDRRDGWNFLTPFGVEQAIGLGMADAKDLGRHWTK